MSYTVLLRRDNGLFTAQVPGFAGCSAQGRTREEAIENVRAAIDKAFAGTEVLTIEAGPTLAAPAADPWVSGRDMLRDDPDFDEVQAEMEAYRRQVDAA